MRVDIPVGLQLLFGSSLYAADEENCTVGLIIQVIDDSDKDGADVVILHGCSQSCLPNPVKSLLEFYEDIVEVLLVLEIYLAEDS